METQRGRVMTLPHRRLTAADCCNAWFGLSAAWSSVTSCHISVLSSPGACNRVTRLCCDYSTITGGRFSTNMWCIHVTYYQFISWSTTELIQYVKTTGSWGGGPQAALFFCLRVLSWGVVIRWDCASLFLPLSGQRRRFHRAALTWRSSTSVINLTLQVKYQGTLEELLLFLQDKQYLQHPVIVSGSPAMSLQGGAVVSCGMTRGWAVS